MVVSQTLIHSKSHAHVPMPIQQAQPHQSVESELKAVRPGIVDIEKGDDTSSAVEEEGERGRVERVECTASVDADKGGLRRMNLTPRLAAISVSH